MQQYMWMPIALMIYLAYTYRQRQAVVEQKIKTFKKPPLHRYETTDKYAVYFADYNIRADFIQHLHANGYRFIEHGIDPWICINPERKTAQIKWIQAVKEEDYEFSNPVVIDISTAFKLTSKTLISELLNSI